MDNLLTLVRREFPGFEPTHLFDAAIPIFFLNVLVEALEPQTLSSFESYFLHAVANEVQTLEEIAWLYGIDETDLHAPGASLLKHGYIWQGVPHTGKRPIHLTDKGRQALGKDTLPPVPTRRGAHLHFNALTWTPIPLEKQLVVSVERMLTEGLCILPPLRNEVPTLGDLTIEKVAGALHGAPYFHNKQIIALLELQRCRQEYLAPVQVLCLHQRKDQQQRLAIYRRSIFQRNESDVLQRFFETGKFFIPDDAIALMPPVFQVPSVLPQVVAQAAKTLVANEAVVRDLQTELEEASSKHATTQSKDERSQLEDCIRELEEALQQKHDENAQLRKQLEQQQGEFLSTEEHRALLERALGEVKQELIIISPWLNRRTCDDALCALIARAVKRGVHVRIGYGITESPNTPDVERNRANARRVIRAMKTAVDREGVPALEGKLEIQRVSDTHRKILICDRAYGVLGSFNWLSYRGELDEQYRTETSIVLHEPTAVAELTRIALQGWPVQR
jgi:hypothetical protein